MQWLEQSFDDTHGRYKAGFSDQTIADETGCSVQYVGQLREQLRARGAPYAQALQASQAVRMALDQVLCQADAPLHPGAEVAFFPPVTGG